MQESESDNETSSTGEGREVVSLLDRLKSTTPANIARFRKVWTNNPPRGKRPYQGVLESDLKGVTPSQRVKEFATESFVVSRGNLLLCLSGATKLEAERSKE